jgi:2-methylcitrate dehydratase PrpD
MTAIEQFADFIAQHRMPSGAVREAVRLHVIDIVGALVAGSHTTEGQALLRFRAQAGSPQDMPCDLMTLTALARLTEIDDIHLASMTTPGAIVIPGALVIAAAQPQQDAETLLTAIVAGCEAMIRLGLALDGPTILYRGIWPTYLAAPFGIAAVASRLMGLDAAQTANALALAFTYAAPGVGHHNAPTTARWLSVGQAARNGLAAAEAARAGFTADAALLEGNFFPGVYGIAPNASAFTDGLSRGAASLDLSFKPWCAARQTMPATQALKEITAEGVAAESITAIKASVLPPHRRMIDHGVKPGDRASYLTSVQYTMAVAALVPHLTDALSPAPEDVPDAVLALMRRITVEPDETLLADYPRVWPAHVTVTTKTGVRERRVTAVPGDPSRPFGEADVAAKFRRFVAPVAGPEAGNRLLSAASGVIAGDCSARDVLQAIQSVAWDIISPAASTRPR